MTTTTTDAAQIALAQSEYDDAKKSTGVAYAFWFFLGALGAHRFYAGDKGLGLGMLFTLGGLGFWALADAFFIGRRIAEVNRQKKVAIFARHGIAVAA